MQLLFIVSNPRNIRHIEGVANAAMKRGHNVKIFFNEESVKLLQDPSPLRIPDVELLACVTACQISGITESELIKGAKMSSLGEMVILMEESDRTLFMG